MFKSKPKQQGQSSPYTFPAPPNYTFPTGPNIPTPNVPSISMIGQQTPQPLGAGVQGPLAPGQSRSQGPVFNPNQAIPQVSQETTPVTPITPQTTQYGTPTAPTTPQTSQETTTDGTSTPTTPVMPPETQKAIETAEKAVQEASKISAEELSTQADIDKLIESAKKAYQGTSEQAIPLEFITGQLKSIENRALGLLEPLESKLARLEATRLSSLETSKFALERADKQAEIDRESVPDEEDGFTLGEKQIRYDAEGNIIARGSGAFGDTTGGGGADGGVSPEAQNWATLIKSGQAKFSDIKSEDMRAEVAGVMGISSRDQEAQELTEGVKIIDTIIEHKGMDSRVGPNAFSRGTFAVSDRFGAGQDFAGDVHKVAGREALENLIAVKSRGATFGALQKAELDLLIQAASKIGDWEIKDKKGEGTGRWNIDEASFKTELETIKRLKEKAIGNVGETTPEALSEEDELRQQGYSEEQIQLIKNS